MAAAAAAASSSSRPCSCKGKAPVICISSDDAEEDDESEDEEDNEEEEENEMAAAAAASSSRSYKRKTPMHCISSDDAEEHDESEDEEEDEKSDCESDEEPESEEESEEDYCVSEDESGSYDDDDDDDDDDDIDDDDHADDDDDDSMVKPTDEDHCNKIITLLRGRKNLNTLKLEECKAYLRKHKLRISGTKEMCFKRILEHWRIKDGNGKKLYPESAFVINCTGDVCRGDVVLFKQRVYEKFDIVKRGGGAKVIGKRVIAGRVVSESYGGSKQQHTFSIDVLWSEGVNPLPHLFPLLVKGRNLYRHKTFRQPWSNEAERSRVLAEKHHRGAAARHVRAIAKAMAVNKGHKLKRKRSGTKAPPNKKRRPDSKLASRKQKKNCAKKSSNGHANTRNAAVARKAGPSAKHSQAKKRRNASVAGKAGPSATHSQAKKRKTGPSPTQVQPKPSKVAKANNSNPSAMLPEQPRHHANGIQRGYQYPQTHSNHNHNHNRPPAEVPRTNSTSIHQENRGTRHLPSHNTGYPSAAGVHHGQIHHGHNHNHNRPPAEVPRTNSTSIHQENRGTRHLPSHNTGYPSAAGVHHGQIHHGHNFGHPPPVRGQGPIMAGYYGNPAFQLDPRRQAPFDDRLPGAQYHGWRRP